MPSNSDKCNSIAVKAMGLIFFLLFNVTSSLDVPFGTLNYVQYKGPPFCPINLTKGVDFVVGM